jgi:hypothetical protein
VIPTSEGHDRQSVASQCRVQSVQGCIFTIEAWRKVIALQVGRARRRSFNFRVAERFGLVQVTGQPVVFHFEKVATADHESSIPEDSVRSHL